MEASSQVNVHCGPEVRNFDQIRVGDTVLVKYAQAVAIAVRPVEGR